MKIEMRILVFVINSLYLILLTSAERNTCCPDPNNNVFINKKCPNGEKKWTQNCPQGAYLLTDDQYVLSENDTITTSPSSYAIESSRYCLGAIENKNNSVAVVCFRQKDQQAQESKANYLFAIAICCTISIVTLGLTIFVYIILPNLRDLQGKCILITITNLMLSYIFLTFINFSKGLTYPICVFSAASMYFWFLTAFFWMNVTAFNIWHNTLFPRPLISKNKIMLYYNLYGFGIPLIFLTVAIILHHSPTKNLQPGWGLTSCWFADRSQIYYFHLPIILLMSLNLLMFISTGWKLYTQRKYNLSGNQTSHTRVHKSRQYKCILYLKLFLTMGISWIFEPLSMFLYQGGSYIWWVTDFINALQGVIIFLLLVVFRKRVRNELYKKGHICCIKIPRNWGSTPNSSCEELEEDFDEDNNTNEVNQHLNQST